jgi:serine/threonine protein kinase
MLKHFRLEGLLGEGGMGLVYRAHDTRLHRPVAVKVLSSDVTGDPDRKQRFLQEARAAARINHPAVAQIFDADEADGITFIVMELVEGRTVRQLILNGELDLVGTMEIGTQIARGLAKAHELGIIHRDIKPANVMRTPDGHVKILDFGLAKLVAPVASQGVVEAQPLPTLDDARTRSGIVMGTPAYMSPEQVKGLPVDARTDIFALGVLLFEMATGQSPFERENFRQALHAAAYEETPPLNSVRAHIPDELQRVVSRCLKKVPDERYPNARLVADDLERIRRHTETSLAQRTSWRQRLSDAWEELRRQPPARLVWYGVGALALLAVLYSSVIRVGPQNFIPLALVGLVLYRRVRNRPQRVQEWFVRRAAKIPEVRLVVFQGTHFTVVVDRPVAQLYGRLNHEVQVSNRKLYFGQPLTLSIRQDLTADQLAHMLSGPGVQYVRPDTLEQKPPLVQS